MRERIITTCIASRREEKRVYVRAFFGEKPKPVFRK